MSSTPPASETMRTQNSSLFKLPPELRLEIYKLTFEPYTVLDDRKFAPLLHVCHAIRQEAMSCFYRRIFEDEKRLATELAEAKEEKDRTSSDADFSRGIIACNAARRAEEAFRNCYKMAGRMFRIMVAAGFPVRAWMEMGKKE